jgi:hypothetical protein
MALLDTTGPREYLAQNVLCKGLSMRSDVERILSLRAAGMLADLKNMETPNPSRSWSTSSSL